MFYHFGLWSGKIAGKSSQALGMNGSSIPGMVGMVFDWNILKRLSKQVENIIIITGTNGKTTTSNLISSVFSETEHIYLSNMEGSNLITGVTSSFINESDLLGKIDKVKYAILEVDEISLVKVLKRVDPKAIVITNFFRDQLDRFGEIDELIKKMEDAIRPKNTRLILNGDDPFSYRMKKLNKETVYFGLNKFAHRFEKHQMSDSKFCPDCGKELSYSHVHYGQLGYFHCSCGFKRPKIKYEVDKLLNGERVSILHSGEKYESQFKGDYNAYNLIATIACSKEFGIPIDAIQRGIEKFTIENGRMQVFNSGNFPYTLNLAKNHQGVNSTLSSYLQDKEEKQFAIFLNDLGADGKDVSWIWDADYELLDREDVKKVICSGRRAYDLGVRMQYAGIPKEKIKIMPDIQEAINETTREKRNTYFISTYTALEFVRETLEEHPEIDYTYVTKEKV